MTNHTEEDDGKVIPELKELFDKPDVFNHTEEDWIKEFEDEIVATEDGWVSCCGDDIKQFISRTIKREKEKSYDNGYEDGVLKINDEVKREKEKTAREIYKMFGVDLDEESPYTSFDGQSINFKKQLNSSEEG